MYLKSHKCRYCTSLYVLDFDVMWGGSVSSEVHPKSEKRLFLATMKNEIRCVFYITVADCDLCGIVEHLDRCAYIIAYKASDYLMVGWKYPLSIYIGVWGELHSVVLRVVTPHYPYRVLVVVYTERPSVHLVPIHLVSSAYKVLESVVYKEVVGYDAAFASANTHIP